MSQHLGQALFCAGIAVAAAVNVGVSLNKRQFRRAVGDALISFAATVLTAVLLSSGPAL